MRDKIKRNWFRWMATVVATASVVAIFMMTARASAQIDRFESGNPAATITVQAGTSLEDVKAELPASLDAIDSAGDHISVPVTWEDGGLYDPDMEGSYIFSSVIDSNFLYENPAPFALVISGKQLGEQSIEAFASDGACLLITGKIPDGAQAFIELIDISREELTGYLGESKALAIKDYVAYDIKIMVDGAEWQPNESVSVTIKNPELPIDGTALPTVAHIDEHTAKVNESIAHTDDGDISFEADGFSPFIFYTYTVDFHYDDRIFSMPGNSSMLLSELFSELLIEKNAADAVSVSFSDPTLLSVEQLADDWKLNSLASFSTDELLSIVFSDGSTLEIKTTDPVTHGFGDPNIIGTRIYTINIWPMAKSDTTTYDFTLPACTPLELAVGSGTSGGHSDAYPWPGGSVPHPLQVTKHILPLPNSWAGANARITLSYNFSKAWFNYTSGSEYGINEGYYTVLVQNLNTGQTVSGTYECIGSQDSNNDFGIYAFLPHITFTKTNATGQWLPGTTFKLVNQSNTVVSQNTSNYYGKVVLTYHPSITDTQTFKIMETKVPDGFAIPSGGLQVVVQPFYTNFALTAFGGVQTQNLLSGNYTTGYKLKNKKMSMEIKFTKVGSDGITPLPGAVFRLYDSAKNPVGPTVTSSADGTVKFNTDLFGVGKTYYISEVSAPAPYVSALGYMKLTIAWDGNSFTLAPDTGGAYDTLLSGSFSTGYKVKNIVGSTLRVKKLISNYASYGSSLAAQAFFINLTGDVTASFALKHGETCKNITIFVSGADDTVNVSETVPMEYGGSYQVSALITHIDGSIESVAGTAITVRPGDDVLITVTNTYMPKPYFKATKWKQNIFTGN